MFPDSRSPIFAAALIAATAAPAWGQATPAAKHDEDLAKAADATAAVATVTAGQPATPAGKSAADDVDLASLGLDPTATAAFDDKLNIYGFADAEFLYQDLGPVLGSSESMFIGHLNLYFAKNLTERWRALAEVRLMFLPNGTGGGTSGTPAVVTTVVDPTSSGHTVEWGGISIERVYVEYDVSKNLTIRAGHYLTPYGIWNIDHGSPAIIPTSAPYIIGERLFPEHQTGLEAFGSVRLGDYRLGYFATLSNGRSEIESVSDPDQEPGYGGRLELEAPWAGTVKLGASIYGGRATVAANGTTPAWGYNEIDYAGDAQWDFGNLHLQAEVVAQKRSPKDGEAVDATHPPAGLGVGTNDGTAWGYYGLAGYRFDKVWNVMPFVYFEEYHPLGDQLKLQDINFGLNFRPTPSVVLKVQYTRAWVDPVNPLFNTFNFFTAQTAWVF